ncbi:MAG: hypothetical protein WD845_14995, partial [Pirellulales bacterium]
MGTGGDAVIRVALLGVDAQTLALARAAEDSRQFELAGACDLESCPDAGAAAALLASFPRLRQFDAWESLLTGQQADVVIVARSKYEDLRAEQLRKLIQTSVPVMTSHPVQDSMLVYYELDMIRRDTNSLAMPYLPERHHPAVQAVRAIVAQGDASALGAVEQVIVQRRAVSTDKRTIVAQFARDVDVIRAVAGDMTRLGAMAGTQQPDSYAGLGVQMSGPASVAARWSVDPPQAEPGGQLTVLAAQGKAVIEMRPDGAPWTLELSTGGRTDRQAFESWSPAAAALEQLAEALAGAAPQPDWVDASRAVELAETIERSLHKSRTIDLYYEDYTEQGTFKGLMTSIGCGLLIFGLMVMGFVAIGDHLGLPVKKAWAYVLAGGMGIFLLLQLLMLVF